MKNIKEYASLLLHSKWFLLITATNIIIVFLAYFTEYFKNRIPSQIYLQIFYTGFEIYRFNREKRNKIKNSFLSKNKYASVPISTILCYTSKK